MFWVGKKAAAVDRGRRRGGRSGEGEGRAGGWEGFGERVRV